MSARSCHATIEIRDGCPQDTAGPHPGPDTVEYPAEPRHRHGIHVMRPAHADGSRNDGTPDPFRRRSYTPRVSTPDDLGDGRPPRPAPHDFYPTPPSSGTTQGPPSSMPGVDVPVPAQPNTEWPNAAQPQFVVAAPTGVVAWAFGLIVLVFLPFFSSLLAAGGMIIAGLLQRSHGELASASGRNAANWELTYLLLTILLVGGHFTTLFLLTHDSPALDGFYPLGWFLTVWAVVTVAHLVFTVVGMIVSSRRKVFRGPAIPFFRRRPAVAAASSPSAPTSSGGFPTA